jgi:hypothetical protein
MAHAFAIFDDALILFNGARCNFMATRNSVEYRDRKVILLDDIALIEVYKTDGNVVA